MLTLNRIAALYAILLVVLTGAIRPAVEASEPEAVRLDLETWWRAEHEELRTQIIEQQKRKVGVKEDLAFRRESLIVAEDRDPADVAARRAAALLVDLETKLPPDMPAKERDRLGALRAEIARTPVGDAAARYRLYESVCKLRRRIALKNPLLNFDGILFVKKHRAAYNHMCDQYYGFHALPGGGLYVLHGAFSDQPKLQDVLAGATVENGRLAGKSLVPGAFLSPELSFDGKTVLFAYVEQGDRPRPKSYRDHDGGWGDPAICFHIFRVNVDGTNLRQLTDGCWNDFDPCFLPNGRIAFISERRGGLGRCHGNRIVPTYTLHAMKADGSGLVPLSYHETNEWHPSVLNDGRIVYTRWDYVDRGSGEAHHPWVVHPDGGDPRALHGNYNRDSSPRANMVMDLRAIPDSNLLAGTAAGHHGQAYGSLVLLDTTRREDTKGSQIRRLTPDVPLPETAEGKVEDKQNYGTAWPLSPDYHLCVYSPGKDAGGHSLLKEKALAFPPYKVCLLDSFGNRELLYADPRIACLSPIPLRPRPAPPALPESVNVARRGDVPAGGKSKSETGIMACVNVYDSRLPWPEGTRITRLRIVQVFPFICGASGKTVAGAIPMSMARGVLGTVPVEADGSAHFEAPAGKVLYFQALDENGLAVQSMKSAAYVAPGERLVCQGCHEQRYDAPTPGRGVPIALRRGPSKIEPDVPGTDPVSFPRLVQPVLDTHCAACHRKEPKAPSLAATPATRADYARAYAARKIYPSSGKLWSGAYVALMPFIWRPEGTRSTPGMVGARASELHRLLEKGHHGVKLPPEDLHRLTVWLDCNANFFGAYHDFEAQARGDAVRPALE
jgi:hypothetical protein